MRVEIQIVADVGNTSDSGQKLVTRVAIDADVAGPASGHSTNPASASWPKRSRVRFWRRLLGTVLLILVG